VRLVAGGLAIAAILFLHYAVLERGDDPTAVIQVERSGK
jgi:hypothetical protein